MSETHPLTQAIIAGQRKEVPAPVPQCLDAGKPAGGIGKNLVAMMRKGAPTTREFAREMGADGCAPDAGTAVDVSPAMVRGAAA